MPRTGWSPNTVPYGADQTVYLVVDRLGSGSVYREAEVERTDFENVIDDFLAGQFNDPVRVVAFNTLEHWANDVSRDVAQVIEDRFDIAGDPVPEHIQDYPPELRPDDAAPVGLSVRKKPAAIGVKAPFPGFIEPALATSIEKVPSGPLR